MHTNKTYKAKQIFLTKIFLETYRKFVKLLYSFLNLKKDAERNLVSMEQQDKIWIPQVTKIY